MYNGILYDSIQGQGHDIAEVAYSLIFRSVSYTIYIGSWQVIADC